MMDKEARKKQTAFLKQLRESHQKTVAQTQELLKGQQKTRRLISKALQDEAPTVPAVAETTGIPADQVLWHLMAMKKYGLVKEMGMDGQYYRYQLAEE
jgi:predicted transcriptional regulator